MSKIKYTTLFNYAVKEWLMTWNECHQIFFKTNAITFHGLSDVFYYDDLVDEIDNEVFPPMWGENMEEQCKSLDASWQTMDVMM